MAHLNEQKQDLGAPPPHHVKGRPHVWQILAGRSPLRTVLPLSSRISRGPEAPAAASAPRGVRTARRQAAERHRAGAGADMPRKQAAGSARAVQKQASPPLKRFVRLGFHPPEQTWTSPFFTFTSCFFRWLQRDSMGMNQPWGWIGVILVSLSLSGGHPPPKYEDNIFQPSSHVGLVQVLPGHPPSSSQRAH